jgi:hypothetical protein
MFPLERPLETAELLKQVFARWNMVRTEKARA